MSRTFSTSRIHREVIQQNGQSGSNHNPALSFCAVVSEAFSVSVAVMVDLPVVAVLQRSASRSSRRHGLQWQPGPRGGCSQRADSDARLVLTRSGDLMVTMSSVDTAAAGGHPHPSQPPNLTREQAASRSTLLTVSAYRIDLDLTDGQGRPG